jgi:hypothetical protein
MLTLWLFFGILAALMVLAFIVRGVTRATHRTPTPHPFRRDPDRQP